MMHERRADASTFSTSDANRPTIVDPSIRSIAERTVLV
jgi:hypothetical protein